MTHKKSIYNNRISVRVSTLFLCAFGLFALKGIHFLCSPNQIFLLENKWYYISSLQILELFLLKILSKEALFYIRLYKDVLQNANFFIWSIKKILSKNNIITYTPFLKKIWPGWHILSFLLKKKIGLHPKFSEWLWRHILSVHYIEIWLLLISVKYYFK